MLLAIVALAAAGAALAAVLLTRDGQRRAAPTTVVAGDGQRLLGPEPESRADGAERRRPPDPVGGLDAQPVRAAADLLRSRVSDRSKAGLIVAQTPLPGKQAPKNAQILVYMGAHQQ